VNNIDITSDVNGSLDAFINSRDYSHIAILVDENTLAYCHPLLKNLPEHHLIIIKSGEEQKTIETCVHVWQHLTEKLFDRNGLLINLGGGVIGDLGGFCARSFKRGMDFINIPTTLLAQVDASIGGKLGIDFNGFKNQIGLFSEPDFVIVDTVFLLTLSNNELRSGFAEVIKHHLIADKSGWNNLVGSSWNNSDWSALVKHSIDIKTAVVKNDPTEKGQRKTLNFGHTIGHGIESCFLKSATPLLHGEAIAIGMICESYISYRKEMLSKDELDQISVYIRSVYGKFSIPNSAIDEILNNTRQDKKNKGNKTLAALLNGIGNAVWDCQINDNEIVEALKYYNQI
jgi:3-dehydroquinate synthase